MIGKGWEGISAEAKALVKKMLTFQPNLRVKAADALNDPWITKNEPASTEVTEHAVFALGNLRTFKVKKITNIIGESKTTTNGNGIHCKLFAIKGK
jgi:calcium-dependent protein kinase